MAETQIEVASVADHLRDVTVKVTVELARTGLSLDEALELEEGSVVNLDRLAGEPVDVRLNGKLFARGEVVTVAENFGVRLTEVFGQSEEASDGS